MRGTPYRSAYFNINVIIVRTKVERKKPQPIRGGGLYLLAEWMDPVDCLAIN